VLHYQPKVDVRSARMVGAEALMRWQRGDTLVPPGDFIPLAEDTGLIVPLSEWALREAARQARQWQLAFGFTDSIAVNLPSRLFERSDLVEHIHQCVTQFGVPHRVIQLEITEDNLMKELQNVIPSLHRLNEIGVEISIDDFGTGYSSLAYLTTLPISELKIDRSFVRELGITPQSSAVVTAIIALARSLGLRVVAEGVESLRQMEVLHRLGCTVMQGFLFSRGVLPDELQRWLEQTVLPRKAPWIGSADDPDEFGGGTRAVGGRPYRLAAGGHSRPAGLPTPHNRPIADPLGHPPRHPSNSHRAGQGGAAPPGPGSARAHAGKLRPRLCRRIRPAASASSRSRGRAFRRCGRGGPKAQGPGLVQPGGTPGAQPGTRWPPVDRRAPQGEPAPCARRQPQ
jgi:EAL domain-containing protein (putative c-di-GMP-specific phosphodiesterase class I)